MMKGRLAKFSVEEVKSEGKIDYFLWWVYTVKILLSGHLQDLPKCLLNGGCPPNRGL